MGWEVAFLRCNMKFYYRGGEILPRKNFSGFISSLEIPQNFPDCFKNTHQIFSVAKFVLPKTFGAFGAISFIFYAFPYGSWKSPAKFFRAVLRKPTKFFWYKICPLRILSATKFPPGREFLWKLHFCTYFAFFEGVKLHSSPRAGFTYGRTCTQNQGWLIGAWPCRSRRQRSAAPSRPPRWPPRHCPSTTWVCGALVRIQYFCLHCLDWSSYLFHNIFSFPFYPPSSPTTGVV